MQQQIEILKGGIMSVNYLNSRSGFKNGGFTSLTGVYEGGPTTAAAGAMAAAPPLFLSSHLSTTTTNSRRAGERRENELADRNK
jgi:hypothetical protein